MPKKILLFLFILSANAYAVLKPEKIYGLKYLPSGIEFQVTSNGCTTSNDFSPYIRESYPLQLYIVREKKDLCKANLPYGTTIFFSYEQLRLQAGDKVVVTNPFRVTTIANAGNSNTTAPGTL